jgi:hypothetical protein
MDLIHTDQKGVDIAVLPCYESVKCASHSAGVNLVFYIKPTLQIQFFLHL